MTSIRGSWEACDPQPQAWRASRARDLFLCVPSSAQEPRIRPLKGAVQVSEWEQNSAQGLGMWIPRRGQSQLCFCGHTLISLSQHGCLEGQDVLSVPGGFGSQPD